MILSPIRDRLASGSAVAAALAVYNFGSGDVPAIFTVDPIPEDAELPAVVLTLMSGSTWGTRAKRGAEVAVDLSVYSDKTGSTAALRAAAWAIWERLNRAELTIVGYEEVGVIVTPPVTAPDPDGFPGLRMTATIRIIEE